jgi:hypothetical protein
VDHIGYALTYPTTCFITGGCGGQVFAHTNGNGDFVLLDSIGPPWPIHECYYYRTPNDGGPRPERPCWDQVRAVDAGSLASGASVNIVGTVTDYAERALGKFPGFRDLPRQAQQQIRSTLVNSSSVLRVVTGEGLEYVAFADLRQVVVAERDIVGLKLRVKQVLNQKVFLVTQIVRLGGPSR